VQAAAKTEPPEEQRVGDTEEGKLVNGALLALSKAARSFGLYDATNALVGTQVEDYRRRMAAALQRTGGFALEVRPFEMACARQVVYVERDRERSLSFRLFRDGVRGLKLDGATPWEEQLKLLEILSIRFTGVRQQEDDVVTLLRKASFRSLVVDAVEGFVPDEERPEPSASPGSGPAAEQRVAPPSHWDLPHPAPEPRANAAWCPVEEAALQALRDQVAPDRAAWLALDAVEGLLRVGTDPADPLEVEEVLPLAAEVRDYLVVEEDVAGLERLARALHATPTMDRERAVQVLRPLVDPAVLARLLRGTGGSPSAALLRTLDLVPGERLEGALALLGAEGSADHGEAACVVVAHLAQREPASLAARIRAVPSHVVGTLLTVLWQASPGDGVRAAADLCAVPHEGTQRAALDVLELSAWDKDTVAAASALLASRVEPVRLRAVEVLARRGGVEAFEPIRRHLEERVMPTTRLREAEVTAKALARLSPDRAAVLAAAWVRPPGLLDRLRRKTVARMPGWAAACAWEEIPGPEADRALEQLADRAEDDVAERCRGALARRAQKGPRP
jgi:hypothetical protein